MKVTGSRSSTCPTNTTHLLNDGRARQFTCNSSKDLVDYESMRQPVATSTVVKLNVGRV